MPQAGYFQMTQVRESGGRSVHPQPRRGNGANDDQRNNRQGCQPRDHRGDDGKHLPAIQEKPQDAQDERKDQRRQCGQPSKGWNKRASARPNQKHRQDKKPRPQREDEADRAEDGPLHPRRRGSCNRPADRSDVALSHGSCLSAVR